jgi:hypothetical protein
MNGILDKATDWLLRSIRGGARSLESIGADQDALLDLARSPQSGTTTMTGAELTLYEETSANPFAFLGGFVDLTNMQAGDTIVLKVYVKIKSGGAYRQWSDDAVNTYTGVQTVAIKHFNGPGDIYNLDGFKVTCTQSAGVNRDVDHSWYDAKRGG